MKWEVGDGLNEPFVYDESSGIFWLESWKKRNPHIQAGFTSRNLGNAPFGNVAFHVQDNPENVLHNRKKLADINELAITSITCAIQTHGNNIVEVEKSNRGAGATSFETSIPDTDGLVTQQPDTMITLFYADCVPLFFFDPEHNAIGIAHAGWRGTVKNIAANMVNTMQRLYGSNPMQICVAIGPSIGQCCYQVDDNVLNAVKNCLPKDWESVVIDDGPGHYRLNLKKLNQILLEDAGILSVNIEISQYCTSCHSQHFFSYRREGQIAGRMAAFAIRKGEST